MQFGARTSTLKAKAKMRLNGSSCHRMRRQCLGEYREGWGGVPAEAGNIVALNMHNNFVLDFEFLLFVGTEAEGEQGQRGQQRVCSAVKWSSSPLPVVRSVCLSVCRLAVCHAKRASNEAFMRLSIYIVVILIYFARCCKSSCRSRARGEKGKEGAGPLE